MLATKVVIHAGSRIVDQVATKKNYILVDKTAPKGAMHKALVLVLTQDTKKGMVADNAAGGEPTADRGGR